MDYCMICGDVIAEGTHVCWSCLVTNKGINKRKEQVTELKKEYNLTDCQLEKVSRIIFSIDQDTDVLKHEVLELSVLFENLGLTINEMFGVHEK